jgi:hypothetical protein
LYIVAATGSVAPECTLASMRIMAAPLMLTVGCHQSLYSGWLSLGVPMVLVVVLLCRTRGGS